MKIKWQRFLVISLVLLLGISIISCSHTAGPNVKEVNRNEFAIPEEDTAEVEELGQYIYIGREDAPWWFGHHMGMAWLGTWRESTVTIELGKGERFEAIIDVEGAADTNNDNYMEFSDDWGGVLFYVEDPNHQKVVDAGYIESDPGFFFDYGFSFTAQTTGKYRFHFIERYGHSFIKMEYKPSVPHEVQ